MKKTLLLTLTALSLVGCGGGGSSVDYFPFRETENSNWGMVAPDGEVLFAGEFTNEPSVVIGGVFRVPNADGKFEIYKANSKPEQIGTAAYLQVGMFTEGVTPAVLENEPVILIDKSGEQVAKLDKLNDKNVESVCSFFESYAVYMTSEGKFGMIDTKGKVYIDATYDVLLPYKSGMAIGLNKGDNGAEVYIVDKSGKSVLLKDTKDMELRFYSEGIAMFKNGDNFIGFNEKGEKVLKLDSKIKKVKEFVGNYAFFSDGDAWGLINKEGEVVVRAKYRSGSSIDKDFVTFLNNDNKVVICDFDGTEKVMTDFSAVSPFYNGKNAFARENKQYIVINTEGKEVSPTTFYSIGGDGENEFIEIQSDYIDLNQVVVNALGTVTANGMSGYEFGTTSSAIVEKYMPNIDVNELKSGNKWSIENKDSRLSTEIPVSSKISCALSLNFDVKPFSAITERVGGWFAYTKTVGYKINDEATIKSITVSLNLASRHANKSESLAKAIVEYVKATGLFDEPQIVEEDGYAYVFQLKNSGMRQLSVSYFDDNVYVYYGVI